MNRYQAPTFRPLFGFAAVAFTALTMALTVVIPAAAPEGDRAADRVLASQGAVPNVRIEPSRIEVIGKRETVIADDRAAGRPSS